jgi:hypothetical protein
MINYLVINSGMINSGMINCGMINCWLCDQLQGWATEPASFMAGM